MKSKVFQKGRLKVRVSVVSDGIMLTTPACTPTCPDDSFSGETIPLDVWREINQWLDETPNSTSGTKVVMEEDT